MTSTELDRITDAAPAAISPSTPEAAERLVAWARAATAAHQLAQALVRTSFAPKAYRGKPDEATAAILAGAELGLDPLAALGAFHDIQGTPAPKASTLRGIALAHGHELDVIEEDEQHAVARYRRKGAREYRTVEWTLDRAKRAGLPGRNPNWTTQPQNMLVARVTSEAARRVAADALIGMPYSAEELADVDPGTVTVAPAQRVTVAELGDPDAPADPWTPPAPEPIGDQRPATQRMIGAVIARLRDLDVEDEDAQRAWLSDELGRPVESRASLTRAEASSCIEVLDVLIDARGEQPAPDES